MEARTSLLCHLLFTLRLVDSVSALRDALVFQRSLCGPDVPFVDLDLVRHAPAPEQRAERSIAQSFEALDETASDGVSTEPQAVSPVSQGVPVDETGADVSPDYSDDDMATTDLFGEPVDDPGASPYDRIEALIPDNHPAKHAQSLEELERIVAETILVPIDEERQNPVFGTGNADADLMIIGEAPGAEEDKTGVPFVGRAGQLLDKILSAVHFERDEVYIANILKSRPPNNRDPLPAETQAHFPFLLKQMVLIQPKMLLCVGRTSGNALLERKSTLAALRDTFHDYHGLPLVVTYHPAALLRNEQWKRPTWEDVKMLRTRYDQLVG